MTAPKITFGKFDGPAYDDGTKSIFVDEVEVGVIERQAIPTQTATSRSQTTVRVGGYQICAWIGPEAAKAAIGPLDGHEFETLGECQRAIKAAYKAAYVTAETQGGQK